MGDDKRSRSTHDPEKLAELASGKGRPETVQEGADAVAAVIKAAGKGTLPAGGTY